MIKFIFTLAFLFFLLMSLLGFSVIRMIKGIFGGGSSNQRTQQRKQTNARSSSSRQTTQNEYAAAQKKKIFSKDEGEYVDYEEVK